MKTHRTTTNNPKHIQPNNAAKSTSDFGFSISFLWFSEGEGEDTCKSSKKWNILIPFTATTTTHTTPSPDSRIWKWFRFIYLHASRFSFPCPRVLLGERDESFCSLFGKKTEKGDGRDFDYPIEFHFNKFVSSTSHSWRTESWKAKRKKLVTS